MIQSESKEKNYESQIILKKFSFILHYIEQSFTSIVLLVFSKNESIRREKGGKKKYKEKENNRGNDVCVCLFWFLNFNTQITFRIEREVGWDMKWEKVKGRKRGRDRELMYLSIYAYVYFWI